MAVPKSRPVHIEYYYDPGLSLAGPRDFPVIYDPPAVIDQLTLQVQQPSRATAFAVSPGFAQITQGSDGFTFREESRAAVQPGQPITAQVAYGKPDANPSLPPAGGAGGATGGSNSAGPSAAGGGSGGSGYLLWVLLAAVAAVAGLVAYRMPSRRPATAISRPAQTGSRAGAAAPPPRPSRSGGAARSSTRPPRTSASVAGSGRVKPALPSHDLETAGGLQRFCTQCGHTFSSTDRFCSQCGQGREGVQQAVEE